MQPPDAAELRRRLAEQRRAYADRGLDVGDLAGDPYEQLRRWLGEALAAGLPEPNAMVLATADPQGRPSSRTVLCKGLDERGVVFYTNFTSAKSRDLRQSHEASATFPWYPMHRQVHVRGLVQQASYAEADAYWAQRPRGSQLGAWASAQSAVVANRAVLDSALVDVERRFADTEVIPRPPHWGGWRIVPDEVEFWQGRHDRMHDRLRFVGDRDTRTWKVVRLAP
jgi:pyridoxamine 5'-phosphate oxidase